MTWLSQSQTTGSTGLKLELDKPGNWAKLHNLRLCWKTINLQFCCSSLPPSCSESLFFQRGADKETNVLRKRVTRDISQSLVTCWHSCSLGPELLESANKGASLSLSASTGVASLITVLRVSRGSRSSSVQPRLPGPLFVQGPQSSQCQLWWRRPQNQLLPWKHRSRGREVEKGDRFYFTFYWSHWSLHQVDVPSPEDPSSLSSNSSTSRSNSPCNMACSLTRCFVIGRCFAAFSSVVLRPTLFLASVKKSSVALQSQQK